MHIRHGHYSDAPAIERVRVRGWQVGYRHVFPPEELDRMPLDDWARWAERLRDPEPGYACFVAERDGRVVGFATIESASDPEQRLGELRGLYVDPDCWGLGVGRSLIEAAEAELAKTWDEAILWTLADNSRTRRFYEAAGWRHDGATSSFEYFAVRAEIVRYAKRLKSSTSRE